MNTKKVLFYTIVVGFLFSMVYQPVTATFGVNVTPGEVVEQAFRASNANVAEVNVQSWSKVNEAYLTVDELKDLGNLVAGTFQQDGSMLVDPAAWQIATGEAEGQRQVELVANQAGTNYSILLQSLQMESNDGVKSETYIVVTISSANDTGNVITMEYQASNAFSPLDVIPQMAVLFAGQLEESLDSSGKGRLVDRMLASVQGKKVEGLQEDFLVSYSSYTPLIESTWWTGNEEINIQVAVRDHSGQNRTLVYVGYPLILTGY
ncbi:MAG: YwmB family TATA-box binding protein [Bacillota bacterium]|nr:YwmB family TATA-box binding protein [Bacillota bacterium]